jgi:hypothetical protein
MWSVTIDGGSGNWIHLQVTATNNYKGKGTPRKLANATRPQFPRKITDFKQATSFQINSPTLRKLMFD